MTGLHSHHVDGRHGPGLAYVATDLVVDLSPADHRLLHLILDDLGLAWPEPGEPVLLHRARRHAVTFGWAADHDRTVTFGPAAARAVQSLWLDMVEALAGGER